MFLNNSTDSSNCIKPEEDVIIIRREGPAGREGPDEKNASLGKNTKLSSNLGETRLKRYFLQAVARSILPNSRLNICMRLQVPGKNVQVWHSPARSKAFYKNLAVCGSIWICPVCASKISERRRQELGPALEKSPYFTCMATFTFRHTRQDLLTDLRFDFESSMKFLRSGGAWVALKEKYGIVGDITGTESTVGIFNGWHLHKHALFEAGDQVDPENFKDDLFWLYEKSLKKSGLFADYDHGLMVSIPKSAIDELYPSKWGLEDELTKSNVKKAHAGFSPFQLLEVHSSGVELDGDRFLAARWFREYAAAMKGVHQLQWSQGLRKLLELGVEKTDEALAVETVETGDILLACLTVGDWAKVLGNDARAELLNIADRGIMDELINFLRGLGAVGWLERPFLDV